jgi:hypothetical protein
MISDEDAPIIALTFLMNYECLTLLRTPPWPVFRHPEYACRPRRCRLTGEYFTLMLNILLKIDLLRMITGDICGCQLVFIKHFIFL